MQAAKQQGFDAQREYATRYRLVQEEYRLRLAESRLIRKYQVSAKQVRAAVNAVRNATTCPATHTNDIAIELPAEPDKFIMGLGSEFMDMGDFVESKDQ